ncbi:Rid family hydrolase [Asanoa siamensis]|uniref:Enamine deaminase RidA (YjgF/YER057c/UK114 family) n=1 Tax=Asanoa siamensis TaxID=926357 RepID=A0ABQ4CV08_9ACTN|nr:Rid family hydrolase [Asanoa siamensis]GIF75114.1 hypothetical protein Asi02nite_46320 [Asanoa siamensis]
MSADRVENFGVPWEESYGYVQAIKRGDSIYLSGQLANDGPKIIGLAPLDQDGQIMDAANTGEQMRKAYENADVLLHRFGASLDDVVEETVYALDIDAAFEAAGPIRKAAYGRDDPQVASTLVGVTRLAIPGQLVEIKMVARV